MGLLCSGGAAAREPEEFTIHDVLSTPIEQLMNVRVTTVVGVEQQWFEAPAALHVIDAEDIRRSGHRTLADALRIVPGVFVGNVNSQSWLVGMRGFSGGLANKTLVLIDGRAVYDPMFAGTFWDSQDVLLEDVDRIEVILGPGATLWGANAVNGVINVITKPSGDTQGIYLNGGGGTLERGFASARYGGRLSEGADYRVWGKYFQRDDLDVVDGTSAHDDWNSTRGGFRSDIDAHNGMRVTVQGEVYDVNFNERVFAAPVPDQHLQFAELLEDGGATGGNAIVRVSRDTHGHGWSLQAYYDRTDRTQNAGFHFDRNTADLDFRHYFDVGDANAVVWGLGARYTHDDSRPGPSLFFDPDSRSLELYSGFVQDTVTLVSDKLYAMVGSKFSHSTFTGFEVQPSGRIWWTPDARQLAWAAVSRPVRLPSRTEDDGFIVLGIVDTGIAAGGEPSGVFAPIGVAGSRDVEAERVLAYEIGYRNRVTDTLTLDASAFYNDYSRLLSIPETVFGTWNNDGEGEAYGGEVTAMWTPLERWRLEASYAYVDVEIRGPVLQLDEGFSPDHQVKARSLLDLTDSLELNSALYWVDEVETPGAGSYVRIDAGLTWRATPNLELSLWGQNLPERDHRETYLIEMERSFYAQATLRF